MGSVTRKVETLSGQSWPNFSKLSLSHTERLNRVVKLHSYSKPYSGIFAGGVIFAFFMVKWGSQEKLTHKNL